MSCILSLLALVCGRIPTCQADSAYGPTELWKPTPLCCTVLETGTQRPTLRLAYLEPGILETFCGTGAAAPSFDQEDPEDLLRLLKIW